MSLLGALQLHEGALRSSLQEAYQIRLLPGAGGRTDPPRSPVELADLVTYLPPGCALWRAAGGELALTDEAMMVRELTYRTEMIAWQEWGSKGNAPKRIPLPQAAGHVAPQEVKKSTAWEKRQAARAAAAGG